MGEIRCFLDQPRLVEVAAEVSRRPQDHHHQEEGLGNRRLLDHLPLVEVTKASHPRQGHHLLALGLGENRLHEVRLLPAVEVEVNHHLQDLLRLVEGLVKNRPARGHRLRVEVVQISHRLRVHLLLVEVVEVSYRLRAPLI